MVVINYLDQLQLGTFEHATARGPNGPSKRLKKQITIRLEEETISYFKAMAEDKGIPYQSLINLYLRDCASEHRQLKTKWHNTCS